MIPNVPAQNGKRSGLLRRIGITSALVLLTLLIDIPMNAAEAAAAATKTPPKTEKATLGGGCFWCLEAFFETFEGVKSVVSGYAGGSVANPNYEQVCTGTTGHAEVVQIEYDPARISFQQLLEIFWEMHDPTTLNQQGADRGTQYRSVILYHDDTQKRLAEESRKAAAKNHADPIVTEIVPLKAFYVAEEDHQDYFRRRPNAPYCRVVISPKLQKLQKVKKQLDLK